MTEFYQVHATANGWRLRYGTAASGVYVTSTLYPTVQAAKLDCWKSRHEIPIRIYDKTEKPFDPESALHRALAQIEARHREHSSVVAVGKDHYLVRYGKYTIEQQVKYRVERGSVLARKEWEYII